NLLIARMEDDVAGRVQLARLLLDVRLERQLLPGVCRRGGELVDLESERFHERRAGGRLHFRLDEIEVWNGDRVAAVDGESVILLIGEGAPFERSAGLHPP